MGVGRLSGNRTVLLDLDGTLYVGSQVMAGAPEAVQLLRDQGLTVRLAIVADPQRCTGPIVRISSRNSSALVASRC